MDECKICKKAFLGAEAIVTLRKKGCEGIARASLSRGDDIHTEPGQQVHKECRKVYCNENEIAASKRKSAIDTGTSAGEQRILRSARSPFVYKEHCLFCGGPDTFNHRRPKEGHKLVRVQTDQFHSEITTLCDERRCMVTCDTLSKLGFCSSYSEVAKFGRNAAITDGTDIPNLTAGHFVQYVADNVDHNVRTIDGMGTFHGMGMIAAITPQIKRNQHIPRGTVSADEISAVGTVNIVPFMPMFDGLRTLCYEKLQIIEKDDPTSRIDDLWQLSFSVRSPRPAWSGFMQMITKVTTRTILRCLSAYDRYGPGEHVLREFDPSFH
ncbi:hypothetical protein BSL78_18414 [Apostichopus japonicus]|uniref:Uncharacterized protein n=1 Tax=Stichopus japonicus TaxID=307972 RepID=A0A2G8K9S7_STIJA|nr:hypothetical protein BSL78_18414 [Apostichopus japonicus]